MIAQTSPPTLPAPQRRHALAKVRSLPTVILVLSLVIHVLIGFFTLSKGHSGASGQDLFIMYTGTRQAARGLNPYTASYLKEALAARACDSGDSTVLEGGFFYPPQSLLLFRPFCFLPFATAFFCWYLFSTILILACSGLVWMEKESGTTLRFAASIVVACMLVNPLTQRMLSLGQTSMIVPGAFAIGHWLIEKRWCWLGPAVISFAAVKPHLALPLLAIMPLLYGWRETIRCAGFVVLFAILGCLVTTGSFHTILDFLHYASTGPLSIGFNQVTYDQIISWNRILYVLSGIAINLSASQILIGYLIVAGLIWTRVQVIQQRRPSRSLLIAAAAMASLFCSQPKGYDLVIVVLTAPYLVRLWREGDHFTPGIILILFEIAAVPRALPAACVRHLHLANGSSEVLLSYRAFATALLLLTILLRGETRLTSDFQWVEST